jgi:hypothetical protein
MRFNAVTDRVTFSYQGRIWIGTVVKKGGTRAHVVCDDQRTVHCEVYKPLLGRDGRTPLARRRLDTVSGDDCSTPRSGGAVSKST